jgi:light-regulated signal transduction histidine kinase (bacteriophytochrome)
MNDPGKTATDIAYLNRELERYKQEYAEFIDIAAHDLDAPLRKLGVLVDRVITECENDSRENIGGYLPRINRCLADMRLLVDNLAILSRVSLETTGYAELKLETVVQEALSEIRSLTENAGAGITVSALPDVYGDKTQYRQLFKSLLQNAVTFAKKDIPPVITVQSETLSNEERVQRFPPGNKEYYRISITDNGIGFHPEHAEKIFRPFVRLHGKSEYAGSGIGLALCKRIAENHQGILYADSKENTGSRFVLIIPQTPN